MRGSILGLLIALYEYRSDYGALPDTDDGPGDDGHGGARSLASSGLKWLLRFVSALVDDAPSVGGAMKSATSGRRRVKIAFSRVVDQFVPKSPCVGPGKFGR